jgi:hypothetical protein
MNIGTVKTGKGTRGLRVCTISKKSASRADFQTGLTALETNAADNQGADTAGIMVSDSTVSEVLKNKGKVYGIYQEKTLVGIYVYERIEDFFVKVEHTDLSKKSKWGLKINAVKDFFNMTDEDSVDFEDSIFNAVKDFFNMTDEDSVDFEDSIFGESKAIYRLVALRLSEVAEEYREQIEQYILADFKAEIEWGQIAGVLSGEKLIYRRNLDKSGKGDYGALGYAGGFVLGMIYGWLVFHNVALGALWGICFASAGGLLLTTSATKQEWATFDFVNKDYVKEQVQE